MNRIWRPRMRRRSPSCRWHMKAGMGDDWVQNSSSIYRLGWHVWDEILVNVNWWSTNVASNSRPPSRLNVWTIFARSVLASFPTWKLKPMKLSEVVLSLKATHPSMRHEMRLPVDLWIIPPSGYPRHSQSLRREDYESCCLESSSRFFGLLEWEQLHFLSRCAIESVPYLDHGNCSHKRGFRIRSFWPRPWSSGCLFRTHVSGKATVIRVAKCFGQRGGPSYDWPAHGTLKVWGILLVLDTLHIHSRAQIQVLGGTMYHWIICTIILRSVYTA